MVTMFALESIFFKTKCFPRLGIGNWHSISPLEASTRIANWLTPSRLLSSEIRRTPEEPPDPPIKSFIDCKEVW